MTHPSSTIEQQTRCPFRNSTVPEKDAGHSHFRVTRWTTVTTIRWSKRCTTRHALWVAALPVAAFCSSRCSSRLRPSRNSSTWPNHPTGLEVGRCAAASQGCTTYTIIANGHVSLHLVPQATALYHWHWASQLHLVLFSSTITTSCGASDALC